MNREDFERLLENALPTGFLNEWLIRLGEVYRSTWEQAYKDFSPPEARDVIPHIRRAKLEGELRKLAKNHGLDGSTYELNDGRNQFHSEVIAKNLLITQSAVQGPKTVVRNASFRGTLAQYNQMNLFGPEPPATEDQYFAMLIHGPDRKDFPWVPAFARIVFPDSTQKYYVENIDLFRLCGFDPIAYISSVEMESIPQTQRPIFLPGVIREQDRE